MSQASPCPQPLVWMWPSWKSPGSAIATRNQELSSDAAKNLCTPNFIASPHSTVTAKAASTTSPQGPVPMRYPSATSSAPITPTPAMSRSRNA